MTKRFTASWTYKGVPFVLDAEGEGILVPVEAKRFTALADGERDE